MNFVAKAVIFALQRPEDWTPTFLGIQHKCGFQLYVAGREGMCETGSHYWDPSKGLSEFPANWWQRRKIRKLAESIATRREASRILSGLGVKL